MSDAHDPPLRESHRGNAIQGLDWIDISGPISEEFALRISSLCSLGPPVDHGDGPACYRRQPEIAQRTRRRTLVIQRHGEGEDSSTGEAPHRPHLRPRSVPARPAGLRRTLGTLDGRSDVEGGF